MPPFHLSRLPVNRDGYDTCGHYHGVGLPVWKYFHPNKMIVGTVFAPDRESAKVAVINVVKLTDGLEPSEVKFYR